MEEIIIEGGRRLEGEINIQGSKNSALPILAATASAQGTCIIHNCPRLTDVDAAIKILKYLGCSVFRKDSSVIVNASGITRSDIPEKLMHEMRSSIVFLGPLLSRFGKAEISAPGGCEIGLRPIDLHIAAMNSFGVTITEEQGCLHCSSSGRLKGTKINLSFPSVGATENIMIAAATASGTTVVFNAAREPEISNLALFLNSCGAKIKGFGEGIIQIEGVQKLHGCEHTVISDRIVASTFMTAAAVTGGRIVLNDIVSSHLNPVIPVFEDAGCLIEQRRCSMEIVAPKRLLPFRTVRTMPYPGFPTDSQATVMSMACIARGTSMIIENIFESRYKHVTELIRLGANIEVEGRAAVIKGVPYLTGARVVSPDLRGGAALVTAGLSARGETRIGNVHLIDRGCQDLEKNLSALGAKIKRIT